MMHEQSLSLVYLDPHELRAHPQNWRRHSVVQATALADLYADVGDAGAALLNDRRVNDGWSAEDAIPTLIDGHLRKTLKATKGEKIPVLVGHWTPAQEMRLLLSFDPIAAMAQTETEVVTSLLAQVSQETEEAVWSLLSNVSPLEVPHEQIDRKSFTQPAVLTPPVISAVFPVARLSLIEQALRATHQRNRGEALVAVCQFYLEHTHEA